MFIHQAGPQALVQYSHLYDSIRAKGELEKYTFMLGTRRYAFEVQYSKLKELVIHKNNNYSRDFRLYPMDIEDCKRNFDSCAGMPEGGLRRDFSQNSTSDDLDTHSLSPSSTASETVENDSFSSANSSPRLQESVREFVDQGSVRSFANQESVCGFAGQDHSSLCSGVGLLQRMVLDECDSPLGNEYGLGMHPPGLGYNSMNRHTPYRDDYRIADMSNQSSFSLFPRNSLYRRDSELSSLSGCSLHTDRTETMPLDDSFGFSNLGFNDSTPLFSPGTNAIRKYVLVGFRRQVPISDLVDLLYGIDIKYAEHITERSGGYAVVIFGRSEWSDAMLTSYLNSNPVDGRIIRLRGASEVVSQ